MNARVRGRAPPRTRLRLCLALGRGLDALPGGLQLRQAGVLLLHLRSVRAQQGQRLVGACGAGGSAGGSKWELELEYEK